METRLVGEVSVNYRGATRMGETLREPAEVAAAFRSIMPDNSREHFMALFLNGSHQTIAYSVVSTGTATAAIVIAHNHPSGTVDPSVEDLRVARSLKGAGDLLGIKLLDHLVITDLEHYSFYQNGKLLLARAQLKLCSQNYFLVPAMKLKW